MNKELRRTILGATFFFSCFMLWNQWLIHTGQKPFLSFGQPAQNTAAPASAPASAASLAAQTQAQVAASGATPTDIATAGNAPAPSGEKIQVATDIFNLTFDTTGGNLVGAKLLKYKQNKSDEPFTLMADNAQLHYMMQTGLIGGNYPNHLTPMTLTSTERALADGQDALEVRFESAPVGNVKLVKTYTLKRGSYAIGVRHEVINTGDAPVSVQLYNQLVRDSSDGPDSHQFYSSFTGPAFYSDEDKYQKIKFSEIDKGSATYRKDASSGYVAMVQS